MSKPPDEKEGPVIRDKRRIDPETGQVREPAETPASGAAGQQSASGSAAGSAKAAAASQAKGSDKSSKAASADGEVTGLKAELAERTADLQRLQAEYSNYRKRVERDRVAVREQALSNVLQELLPVLDDIGRARDHDELTGGFKSVAESLETLVGKLGLVRYGEKGEPFDPTVHEALMHSYSADVTEATCVQILQPGYRIGERVIRPARVAVAEPGQDDGAATAAGAEATAGDTEQGAATGSGGSDSRDT